MCLILFSYRQHARYPFILAANRDEFLDRPAARADFWDKPEGLLAGKDIRAGGTWMGITRELRFAALTNYRDPALEKQHAPSRGQLVLDFLAGDNPPESFLQQLRANAGAFNGFNLLVGNPSALWYYSNVADNMQPLESGLYGLSNHLLDTAWPKVEKGKRRLREIIQKGEVAPHKLLDLLGDTAQAPDTDLPQTGVPLEWERKLSAMCIQTPDYGTRVSTAILIDTANRVTFVERSREPGNNAGAEVTYDFTLE